MSLDDNTLISKLAYRVKRAERIAFMSGKSYAPGSESIAMVYQGREYTYKEFMDLISIKAVELKESGIKGKGFIDKSIVDIEMNETLEDYVNFFALAYVGAITRIQDKTIFDHANIYFKDEVLTDEDLETNMPPSNEIDLIISANKENIVLENWELMETLEANNGAIDVETWTMIRSFPYTLPDLFAEDKKLELNPTLRKSQSKPRTKKKPGLSKQQRKALKVDENINAPGETHF